MIKKIVFLLIYMYIPTFFVYSETVKINKIKVIGNWFTESRVILDYGRGIKSGQQWDKAVLERRLRNIKELLKKSRLFYNVQTFLFPSMRGGQFVNVIIEVKEGFLYRFWGGNLYVGFGKDNIGGKGVYMGSELGYNRQTFYYKNQHIKINGVHPFIDSVVGNRGLYYNDSHSGGHIWYQSIGEETFTGLWLSHNIHLGLQLNEDWVFTDGYRYCFNNLFVGLRFEMDLANSSFSPSRGIYMNIVSGYFPFQNIVRFNFDERHYLTLVPNFLTYALNLKFGVQSDSKKQDFYRFSIYGQKGVRKVFDTSLFGDVYWTLRQEIRLKLIKTSLFRFVMFFIEPAIFVDLGKAYPNVVNFNLSGISVGYGLSLRLYFGMPVYMPISIDFGFNQGFEYFLSVTKPF